MRPRGEAAPSSPRELPVPRFRGLRRGPQLAQQPRRQGLPHALLVDPVPVQADPSAGRTR